MCCNIQQSTMDVSYEIWYDDIYILGCRQNGKCCLFSAVITTYSYIAVSTTHPTLARHNKIQNNKRGEEVDMAIIWRYEHMICHLIMQMLSTTQHSTTQHNQTQQQLVVKVEYRGGNVFLTTNSEGGIYLHVLEDR